LYVSILRLLDGR